MVYKETLPSGGMLYLSRSVDWADLVVSEGFIESRFFANFSKTHKKTLPDIAARTTVLYDHDTQFL